MKQLKCTAKNLTDFLNLIKNQSAPLMPGRRMADFAEFDNQTTLRHAVNTIVDWMEEKVELERKDKKVK